ncbi:MAG: hypothetical protein ACJARK_000153, partial [Marinobacter psychrophilus]
PWLNQEANYTSFRCPVNRLFRAAPEDLLSKTAESTGW